MTQKQDLSRRDFIKATTAFIGGLIGVSIGLPSIAYPHSPSLRKTEDEFVKEIENGNLHIRLPAFKRTS